MAISALSITLKACSGLPFSTENSNYTPPLGTESNALARNIDQKSLENAATTGDGTSLITKFSTSTLQTGLQRVTTALVMVTVT
nr:Uncharacterised protein [Klebsiella pneumoniae]